MPSTKSILNNRWLVGGLCLLALGLGARAALQGRLPALAAAGSLPPEAPAPAPAAAPAAAFRLPAPPVPARDPFAARPRLAPAAAVVERVQLSALWTEHGETLALVNGRILRPGDQVGQMRIESASQEGVWVAHARGRDFIALGATFVLTTPAAAAAPL